METVRLPLWWSWLWWPTTLVMVTVASGIHLLLATAGLDRRRRWSLVGATAVGSAVVAMLFLGGASAICADGASLRAETWAPVAAGLAWFAVTMALGHLSGIPVRQVWILPVLGLVGIYLGYIIESIVALHTLSRYCEGIEVPLWVHSGIAAGLPTIVVAIVSAAAYLARRP